VSAPAGKCEWCGGPQSWTIVHGEMFVACELGCLPLPFEGLEPPPDGEFRDSGLEGPSGTSEEEGGTGPCEGGGAKVAGVVEEDELPW